MTIRVVLNIVGITISGLIGLAVIGVLVVYVAVPVWISYERFLSVQSLEPQLKLVPPGATFLTKSQQIEPEFLTTAVYIDYQYKLAPISFATVHSYYDAQLLQRGWQPSDATHSTLPPSQITRTSIWTTNARGNTMIRCSTGSATMTRLRHCTWRSDR